MQFKVAIPNLPALQEALAKYPAISAPIVQRAILGSLAALGTATNASTVPQRTGMLLRNWGFDPSPLQGRYWPRQTYAPYVEFGTAPHIIKAKNARVLANTDTKQVFGPVVHHPGTKANPFMERIVAAAQPAINDIFATALTQITQAIAAQSNA